MRLGLLWVKDGEMVDGAPLNWSFKSAGRRERTLGPAASEHSVSAPSRGFYTEHSGNLIFPALRFDWLRCASVVL